MSVDESTLPISLDDLQKQIDLAEEEERLATESPAEPEPEPEPEFGPEPSAFKQEEIFKTEPEPGSTPEPKKKKKRQLSQKQLDSLAAARKKGLEKRRAKSLAKKKEEELIKLEKTKHIRERRRRQLEDEARIAAFAEEEHEKKEKAAWDEEKLTALMNRTLDTYFDKRKKEKQHRATVPTAPEGYYIPAQPPAPVRALPRAAVAPAAIDRTDPSHPDHNPYLKLFNLK